MDNGKQSLDSRRFGKNAKKTNERSSAKPAGVSGGKAASSTAPKPVGTSSRKSSGKPTSGKSFVKGSAREAALEVLTRIEQDRSYSNLLLNQTLQKYKLDKPDAGLSTEIVYGTVQRLNTIDYFLEQFVAKGLAKLEPWVRNLLRLSFYQLYYLDRIPDHAVVNEAVNLAKRKGHQGISGMVNGVLRSVIREKAKLVLPDNLPPDRKMALSASHPEWMVKRWVRQFGEQTAKRICEANNEPPHVSIRVNLLQISREELIARLRAKGLEAEASVLAPAGVIVRGGGNMALAEEYKEGLYSIQDESSMLVAEWMDPKPGERVLDCCAAPGGKATHLAEKMGDRGEIIACDVHEHKEQLIREQAERLGLRSIRTVTADARRLAEHFAPESFDRILLDAPCSGLGVIRRKPDMKWGKKESELADICMVQRDLLEAVHKLLKPGGLLVYSTCTIEGSENDEMIRAFLEKYPEFIPDPPPSEAKPQVDREANPASVQILPFDFGSDGFFIARLRRRA